MEFLQFFAFMLIISSPFYIKRLLDHYFSLQRQKVMQQSKKDMVELAAKNAQLTQTVETLEERVRNLEAIVTDSRFQLDQELKKIA